MRIIFYPLVVYMRIIVYPQIHYMRIKKLQIFFILILCMVRHKSQELYTSSLLFYLDHSWR